MSDAIGELRHRVRLEHPTRAADDLGGAAITWIDAGEAWAAIAVRGAGEAPAHDGARSWTSYTVTLDRRSGVRVGWRVIWGARALRVVGVLDDGAPRLDLICEEERP